MVIRTMINARSTHRYFQYPGLLLCGSTSTTFWEIEAPIRLAQSRRLYTGRHANAITDPVSSLLMLLAILNQKAPKKATNDTANKIQEP